MTVEISEEILAAIRHVSWMAEAADTSVTDINSRFYNAVNGWLDKVE